MTSGDDRSEREVTLIGRKLSEIPCIRETYLYAICAGMVSGLAFFVATSRTRLASHAAVGTYAGVTLTYWLYCRNIWNASNFKYRHMKQVMERREQDVKAGSQAALPDEQRGAEQPPPTNMSQA